MIYAIPDFKLKKLEKQISHIRNKGANITFDVLEPIQIAADNAPLIHTPGHHVEVDGSYKINGWDFVATIDHTPAGNIIRCVNSDLEKKIPEKYKDCGPECEHCHRIRNRKDTYLIYNEENDEWKQVGRACLKEYTGGLDSEVCAQIASVFRLCEDAENWDDDGSFSYSSNNTISADLFKRYALPIVKKHGYQKMDTVSNIIDAINRQGVYGPYVDAKDRLIPEEATDDEIKEIDDYANSISDDQFGYIRNAKLTWLKKYVEYRDLALLASFIATYFKNKAEIAKRENSRRTTKTVGNVGDRITVNVKSVRALYSKSNRQYSYYAEPSTVYEIIDNNGNTFICDTQQDLSDVTSLVGTVKRFTEFRGVNQTVITRVKVLTRKNKEQSSGLSARDALDSIIDDYDIE